MTAHSARAAHTGPLPRILDVLIVLVTALPIIALAALAISGFTGPASAGILGRLLPLAVGETFVLLAIVGTSTAVLGLGSAWLVTHRRFPGHRLLSWALVLPLAVPTYLSAYAWVELLEFTGPVQTLLRGLLGVESAREYWFFTIRSPGGAAFVMSVVLYPYVYLTCRAFFALRSGAVEAAARALGAGPVRTFFTIVLPLSRPALVVGVSLVLLEVLNDFGAVSFFGVNTMTAAIYATWINLGNLAGAAQIAIVLLFVVGLVIYAEVAARKKHTYLMPRDSRTPHAPTALSGIWGGVASAGLFGVVLAGFGLPVAQLGFSAIRHSAVAGIDPGVWRALGQTVLIAGIASAACLVLGYVIARRMRRPGTPTRFSLLRLGVLGYAIPGTVLAVGLAVSLGTIDAWINTGARALTGAGVGLILSGSMFALVYAYVVRFLMISHGAIDAGLTQRGDGLLDAARVLGAGRWERLFRVELPTLWPTLAGAAALVFIECVKELPATLLLRPLGLDTLATFVYASASAELFSAAALPALMIVAVGALPVFAASRLKILAR
ncbi:MAG: iron ABC transporter permease [Alphaproteobacteria bacterium]|nr:iron ABC transporter permease [Alphaproteobacteria bacterium]